MTEGFDVLRFAEAALAAHGLEGWTVRWDRAKRRAGCCVHARKEISISKPLARLYPGEVIRGVVLHEIAHALAGPEHNHDAKWRSLAQSLGAPPTAKLPASLPSPSATWVGTCPNCGMVKALHSAPRRVVACGKCSGTFDPSLLLQWTKAGIPTEPGGVYAKELRRLKRRFGLTTLKRR